MKIKYAREVADAALRAFKKDFALKKSTDIQDGKGIMFTMRQHSTAISFLRDANKIIRDRKLPLKVELLDLPFDYQLWITLDTK